MRIEKLRKQSDSVILRYVLLAFTIACLIGAVCAPDRGEMLSGLRRIVTLPSQLTKDYFFIEIGSISGAFLNAALVGTVCCLLMYLPGAVVTGTTVAAYMLTVGYCFYGINILNMLPFVLGTFIYSRIKREPFGKYINFAMFSSSLAPLVSEMLFRYPGTEVHGFTIKGILLALVIGVAVSIRMPAFCAHTTHFHKGYNLYNAGPAAGFMCLAIFAIMYKTLGVEAPAIAATLGEGNRAYCNIFAIVFLVLCLIFGGVINGGFKGYGKLLTDTGYKVDFMSKYGVGLCIVNLGVYGLFILGYYNLIGAKFTGATFGAVWCMLAFGAAGAMPLNVLPIMLGYFIASRFGVFALNAQAIVVGLCYASGLAPIAGKYGPIAGIVAGILHYCLVTSVPAIHGGFNLYNGGFTSGIVAYVMVPMLESFAKPLEERYAKRIAKK
ncbi:MAG: DUF1576 domain-containing protein [Aristaeellaceae bacterium]